MLVVSGDQSFCRIAEVCPMIGVSRNAPFRWLKEGIISDVEYRDRRGWRLFTPAGTETIRPKTCHITVTSRKK
jgi:predicted site-specific integrase-resolvase